MPYDAYAIAAPAHAWSAEVAARIADLVSRRISDTSAPVRERIDALVDAIATAKPLQRVKGSLQALLAALRARGVPIAGHAGASDVSSLGDEIEAELARFHARIREHGRTTSIENYASYLFVVV